MRPFGLTLRNSGAFCSFLLKSRYTDSYVNPSSSRMMATFLRIEWFSGAGVVRLGGSNIPAVGSTIVGVQGKLLSVRHGELAMTYTWEVCREGLESSPVGFLLLSSRPSLVLI